MLVLGIDPGTATTGYGVVRSEKHGLATLVECGVIRTRARDPLPARLREIHEGVRELIGRHQPDAMAVEDIFYAKNVRTTVTLGHARGVILLAGELAGVSVFEYPPAEIKKAVVGHGGATKEQVQFMLTRLLRLKAVPQPSDAADGVAIALTYCMAARVPTMPSSAGLLMPATARREARASDSLAARRAALALSHNHRTDRT
jgi:crossover junction endodeoxyribonuclease RuvC